MEDSADAWIMNYPEVAPAFVAARRGYDVWLGNNRGNKYNHEHVSLTTDDKEFWQYSWPELGTKDLRAMFEAVKERTGQEKLAYVGYSLGSTSMFYALVKDQPFIQDTVSVFIALGPATKISHSTSKLVQEMSKPLRAERLVLERLGVYSLFEPGYIQNRVFYIVCGFFPSICDLGIEALATTNIEADDQDRMQVYMGHFPAGESTQVLFHYAQTYKQDAFQEFDYSRLGN